MTPKEIVETVEGRLPVLLYQGYRLDVDPLPTDGDGDVILWPKELKMVFSTYARKAGIKKMVYIEGEDLDPVEYTIDIPSDFRALDITADNNGSYIRTKQGTRIDGAETIKTIKFLPLTEWEDMVYPIRMSYFIDLASYANTRDQELPPECDFDLMCDYLEALVGVSNANLCNATQAVDMDVQQKEMQDYIQQKTFCEERFANLRSIPSVVCTG